MFFSPSAWTLHRHSRTTTREILLVVLLSAVALVGFQTFSVFRPVVLRDPVIVTIPEGYDARGVTDILEQSGVIRSSSLAWFHLRVTNQVMRSGTYRFEPGMYFLKEILKRVSNSEYGDAYTKVTIPEGSTNSDIATILVSSGVLSSEDIFLRLVQEKEGYLFPDTYFFLPDEDETLVVARLEQAFDKVVAPYQDVIEASGKSLDDIVTMASIIEREAAGSLEEMQMVSGILWKRIDKGMPLQVDAPFVYATGKGSSDLTTTDLRADGPYNTYTNLGLPPTPIGNPGKDALYAAIYPKESVYFFYLHDTNGNIHYAKTHDEHVANKRQYLN